jgi:thiol-disulfide isomerase/thioredoxin
VRAESHGSYPKLASLALGLLYVLGFAGPYVWAQSASEQELKSVDPQAIKALVAANKGKVVFLNFFATYCVPCHTEFPDIMKLQTKYKDSLQVVEVSMNDRTDAAERAEMLKYLAEQKPPFPVYIASSTDDDFYKSMDPRWAQSEALPMTMIFDRDGKEAHFYQKALTLADMEHDVTPLLASSH